MNTTPAQDNPAHNPAQTRQRRFTGPILTATALVAGALLVVQAVARVPQLGGGGPGSRTGMVSQSGPYTVMTSDAGNEDIVIVLDNRSEQLLVYKLENSQSLQLFQKLAVSRLFLDAKAKAAGK